jgi:phosphate-selective porin OprO/OprP
MKRIGLVGALALILLMTASPVPAQQGNRATQPVEAQILEILIEKNIITPEQYQKLKTQLSREEDRKNASAAEAGFDKGFYIRSADGKHEIKLKGRFHGDFKGYLGNHPDNDSFFVRRARLALQGKFYNHFEFKLESEFGKGDAKLNDGYANIAYFPRAQLKMGQFKTPFSMEELHSDNWIDFVERSLANNLVPSRDIGVMLHGGLWDGSVYYQLGLFNGFQ